MTASVSPMNVGPVQEIRLMTVSIYGVLTVAEGVMSLGRNSLSQRLVSPFVKSYDPGIADDSTRRRSSEYSC